MDERALVVGGLAVLAACAEPQAGPLGEPEAMVAAGALGNGIEDLAARFGTLDRGAGASAACASSTGDASDPDGDGIPVDATLTYSCEESRLGYSGTLSGTLAVEDDDPAAVAWAFTGAVDTRSALAGADGASITIDRDGQVVATQTTGSFGPFVIDRAVDVVTVLVTAGETTTVTESTAWTMTYRPLVAWSPGSPPVPANLSLSGTWSVNVGNSSAEATLSNPSGLSLSPSCATRVTAGSVTAAYLAEGATRSITVIWTGCGDRTLGYSPG